jgi:hypothetical protein
MDGGVGNADCADCRCQSSSSSSSGAKTITQTHETGGSRIQREGSRGSRTPYDAAGAWAVTASLGRYSITVTEQ